MVDINQNYGGQVDIEYRRLSADGVRLEGIRYLMAIGAVLAIVTFTLTALTFFYSASV